jgi:hypothetical protein
MKIKQVRVAASRTVNLGNFNSLKIEGECTVEVEDGESTMKARAAALDEVKIQLGEAYKKFRPKSDS